MAVQAITKQQLLDALRESGAAAVTKLAAIPAAKFEDGCYENGWNARQVLAHVASIEWSYPRLIDVARDGDKPREKKPEGAEPPQRKATGGINDYNQRQIERYADTPVAELLDVFRKNREATIAAVEATDDALFAVPVKSAGGIPGPLGTVLNYVAVVHVNGHVNDIVQAAG
ncbi:MAG TPA: maleylpyruvate isomerase N-terminal domain-containing protein [Dehalococcoidia bacterium]|jgi:hypothetical protein|nr:maleylpyruvate isomerase N-terminal domain-containing protein [Dehalococcoidia bacterium]